MNQSSPQGSGFLDFFKNMTDEERQAFQRMGKAAANLAQPMNAPVGQIQRGGGLLQQLGGVPPMTYGSGMNATPAIDDDDATGIEKFMGLLERLASAGVIG